MKEFVLKISQASKLVGLEGVAMLPLARFPVVLSNGLQVGFVDPEAILELLSSILFTVLAHPLKVLHHFWLLFVMAREQYEC